MEVTLDVLGDRLDLALRVVGERPHDQVAVVAAEVVQEHRDVVHHSAFPVAHVVRRTAVVAGHMVVVGDFAVIWVAIDEWTVLTVANATLGCISVLRHLCTEEWNHRTVLLEVIDALTLPLDEFVEELFHRVLTGEEAEPSVECTDLRTEKSGSSTWLVLLVEICGSSLLIVGCEHRLEVGVDHERCPRAVFPVRELELRAGLWHDVNHRGVVVTGAELLVTSQNLRSLKMTETALAEELLTVVLRQVREQTAEILDPGVVSVEVEEIDLRRTVSPADVQRVASAALVVVVADEIDTHVQLLFDLTDIGRVDRVLETIETVLGEVIEDSCSGGRDGSMSNRMECRGNRISEAPVVGVVDIHDRLLVCQELWEWGPHRSVQRIELDDVHVQRVDLRENQTGLVADEFGIHVPECSRELIHLPLVWSSASPLPPLEDRVRNWEVGLDRFEVFVHRVGRLVADVDERPHFYALQLLADLDECWRDVRHQSLQCGVQVLDVCALRRERLQHPEAGLLLQRDWLRPEHTVSIDRRGGRRLVYRVCNDGRIGDRLVYRVSCDGRGGDGRLVHWN